MAADDGRCSEIGASMLRRGGHAVDAAVATAICVGVVNPMASGIGGGAFMIIRSASSSKAEAFDMRETAPLAASKVTFFICPFLNNRQKFPVACSVCWKRQSSPYPQYFKLFIIHSLIIHSFALNKP